jgi:lysine 2-monooxygenase
VIDLEGVTYYAHTLEDLPPLFTEVADAWAQALEDVRFAGIQDAIRARDVRTLKSLWNDLVPRWDDRTFYDFVASSKAFSSLSFRHREVFGHVGFGTGGWDSDYPNSMLEIFRGVMTSCDQDQRLVVGGAEQVPPWALAPSCTSTRPLAGRYLAGRAALRAPRAGVAQIARAGDGRLAITDTWGDTRRYAAVLVTCQSWLLTTQIECEESVFSQKIWMAWTAPATCSPPRPS